MIKMIEWLQKTTETVLGRELATVSVLKPDVSPTNR